MVKLRKFVAYRRLERPYTRVSKFKKKSFIRTTPHVKVVRFNMGNIKKSYEYKLELISKSDLQIRDNALESAREVANKLLEKTLGINGYFLRIKAYPYHILRENPLATGAGADRFSTGMQKSFGKPIGQAARVKKGKVLFELHVDKQHFETAKKALKRAQSKLPCSCLIQTSKNQQIFK